MRNLGKESTGPPYLPFTMVLKSNRVIVLGVRTAQQNSTHFLDDYDRNKLFSSYDRNSTPLYNSTAAQQNQVPDRTFPQL